MTKQEIFKKAHELTRKMKAEFPEINYRAQFSIFLKELYKDNTNTVKTVIEEQPYIKRKPVTVNNITRSVAIKLKGNILYGMINNTKFIWNKDKHRLPTLDIVDKDKMLMASQLAIPFINGRLNMDKEAL